MRFQNHIPVNRNLSAFCEVRPYSLVDRKQQPGRRCCYYWRGREVFLDTEDCNSTLSQTTVSTCKYTRPHIPEKNNLRVKVKVSLFTQRRHIGGEEICHHSFWALTVDGGLSLSLTSRPVRCTPGTEHRYLLDRRKGGSRAGPIRTLDLPVLSTVPTDQPTKLIRLLTSEYKSVQIKI